jgi:hypothetical protein
MENSYLNSMLTFIVYLRVIQKQNKNTLLINRKKKKNKKKIYQKIHHIYLLSVEREKLNFY